MNVKLKRAIQLATLGTASFLAANSASANNKELLQILLSNGAINQEQFDALAKSADSETNVKLKDGSLKITSGDDEFEFQVGGRVMVDAAWFGDDSERGGEGTLGDGTELRRARMFISGKMWNDWHFKGQYDFAGDEVSVKDAYIRYTGLEHVLGFPLDVTVGHFKEDFSLEQMTSSKYITFMERSMNDDAFVPGRKIGLELATHGEVLDGGWHLSGGWFGSGVEDDHTDGTDESYGLVTRATFAPIATKTEVLHFGGGMEYRKYKGEDVRVRARPEAHIADDRLVDVTIDQVDDVIRYNAEFAAVYGPFSAQAEYFYNDYDSETGEGADFEGMYGYVSWFITGESRQYKAESGEFSRIKPKSVVGKGGYGAWELAARYSHVNLNDGDLTGGRESNWTFGLNWYATSHVRFMANYVIADTEGDQTEEVDPDIMQVRAQIDF